MSNVKDKIYNYEVAPPPGVWDAIAKDLNGNEARIIPFAKKSNKLLYFSLAAASVAIIAFIFIFFNPSSAPQQIVSTPTDTSSSKNEQVLMTVPLEENKIIKKEKKEDIVVKKIPGKKNTLEKKITEEKTEDAANEQETSYITMAGPEGQTIKISAKAATLIDSSNEKPVWNKKVKEWKEIMKANTLAPTPGNFMDIIELTKSLKKK